MAERLTYSVREASALLGISANLGYRLARSGKLPGTIAVGERRLLVAKSRLNSVLANGNSTENHTPGA